MSGIVGKNLGRGSGLVKVGSVGADSVTGASIADDAIDSEHYTDGSIDNAHLADDAVGLAEMASGTDGQIITYDASGNPTAVGPGSDGEVLTSTGAGSPPAFEAAAGGGDLSFGGDTFGADKTIGSNDTYALSFETDGNVAMKIDTVGHITMPLQSSFFGYPTSSILNYTAGGGHITVALNGELWDLNGDYNTSTYTFTAPVTGKYMFTCKLNIQNLDNGATAYEPSIFTSNRYYNFTTVDGRLFASDRSYSFQGSLLLDMDINDTAYARYYQSGGSSQVDIAGGQSGTWLTGYLAH